MCRWGVRDRETYEGESVERLWARFSVVRRSHGVAFWTPEVLVPLHGERRVLPPPVSEEVCVVGSRSDLLR